MSPSIWTRCEGKSELRPFAGHAWRVVEAQHLISTRKLVDSDEEQQRLEELIERRKPARVETERPGLHYLLFTPFRYPPLRHGSRFGRPTERGLWYGSTEQRTAFAELSYYRLLFLEGTAAELSPLTLEVSIFQAKLTSDAAVDLTAPPFDRFGDRISSPNRYSESQQLGGDMRQAGVELFCYLSARDTGGGTNLGVFSPHAFARRRPNRPQAWFCIAERDGVEVIKKDVFERESHLFPRSQFEVDGALPSPAV